jgi:integrase
MVDRSQTSGGTSSYRRQAARKAAFAPFRFHDLRHLFALRGGIGVCALSHHLGYGSVSVTEIDLRFFGR